MSSALHVTPPRMESEMYVAVGPESMPPIWAQKKPTGQVKSHIRKRGKKSWPKTIPLRKKSIVRKSSKKSGSRRGRGKK